jgi:hemerythrin HHE cation binding domain-containing protein
MSKLSFGTIDMKTNHKSINALVFALELTLKSDQSSWPIEEGHPIKLAYHQLSEDLLAHMEQEDSIFYDKLESESLGNREFYQLISDHLLIRELLDDISLLLDGDSKSKFIKTFSLLKSLLEQHCYREEALMSKTMLDLDPATLRSIGQLRLLHNES